MWWPWKRTQHQLSVSVAYCNAGQTCVVTVAGQKGIFENDAIVWESVCELLDSESWTNLAMIFCDLRPVNKSGFGTDLAAMLLMYWHVAVCRDAQWTMAFRRQAEVEKIFELCKLWGKLDGHLIFTDDPSSVVSSFSPTVSPTAITASHNS